MKKFIAYLLMAVMCVSCLAGCGDKKEEVNEDLQAAVDYVYAMYKDAAKVTANDFERTTQVMVGTVKYEVEWTVDTDKVKVTVADKVATIDVDEKSAEEVAYTLTATVKDADGNKASKDFKYTVPAFEGYSKIVEDAYKLESGATMDGTFTLEGVITSIKTPWDSGYKNISVVIQIDDMTDKPILCYRLKDGAVTGCEGLKVGDTIKVTGSLTNYNGTIEFAAGCTLDALTAGEGTTDEPDTNTEADTSTEGTTTPDTPSTPDTPTTPSAPSVTPSSSAAEIMNAAYALGANQTLEGTYTLSGIIDSVDTAYDSGYKNVTVTITVDGSDKKIMCYRLAGTGADEIGKGDWIKVSGTIVNYVGDAGYSTIEFKQGCTLDEYKINTVKTSNAPADTSASSIVAAAYALGKGETLDGGPYTLTGTITKLQEPQEYNGAYDRNVTIEVEGKEFYCYCLKGDILDLEVGDSITVTGTIKNYNGTVEYDKAQLVSVN